MEKDFKEFVEVLEKGVIAYIQRIMSEAGHQLTEAEAKNMLGHLGKKVLIDILNQPSEEEF